MHFCNDAATSEKLAEVHKSFLIRFQRRKTKIIPLGFSQKNSLRVSSSLWHVFHYVASLTTQKTESQYFFNLEHQKLEQNW